MNILRHLPVLLFAVACLSACATQTVMNAATEQRLVINECVKRVLSAQKTGGDGELAVCLEVMNLNTKVSRKVLMRVPSDIYRPTDKYDSSGIRFVGVNIENDIEQCDGNAGSMPIYTIVNNSNINGLVNKIAGNGGQAIYAIETSTPRLGHSIANIGYIYVNGDKGGYVLRQFLFNHELYRTETVTKNPWMYALLPVALVADAVSVVALTALSIKSGSNAFASYKLPKKKPLWGNLDPNQPMSH